MSGLGTIAGYRNQRVVSVAGLREKQKAERRRLIRDTAMKLFSERGYRDVKVDDIAAGAGMSVPTLFKYYASKQELLYEFLWEYNPAVLDELSARMDDIGNTVDILCELENAITAYDMTVASPSLWRELLPLALAVSGDEMPEVYRKSNDVMIETVAGFLQQMKDKGYLAESVNVVDLSRLINDAGHMQMMRLISQEPLDWEKHRQDVRAMMTMLCNGLTAD